MLGDQEANRFGGERCNERFAERLLPFRLLRALPVALAVKIPALSTGFLEQKKFADFDPLVQRFAHVVDREGGSGSGYQSFHFHAGLGGSGPLSANVNAL